MRQSHIILLFIGAVFLFFSCSKENSSLTPDLNQNDQETSILKKAEKMPFEGESNFIETLDFGTTTELPNGNVLVMGQVSVWCETADVDLVTGRSIWFINSLTYPDGSAHLWGKADIFVFEDCVNPDGNDGKWRLSWQGDLTPTADGFIIEVDGNGTGKEGVVKGMVGKWTYTMNFADGFYYISEGYIK